ncbi:endonuclease V [Geospiza fortis]|uniref:Endonuclease V n=1 Tax=Geospiza fortis TaxID=48883 RepID=A0A8N5EZI0_GEOFO|nr:endonuclease V [Geospiza fortis]
MLPSCRGREEPQLQPQVLLVDGNGLLHPREFGIACHLGVLTDLPCIGVAKNLLHVDGLVRDELHKEQVRSLQRSGEAFPLTGTSGKVLGMADIRSREYLRRQPCAPAEGLEAVPASPESKKEDESED